MHLTIEQKTSLLLGLFIASIIAANLLGGKIANFGIFEASVGILAVPLMFLVTDIIEEVHGKQKAKEFVYIGFVCLVFVLALTFIAVNLPSAARDFFPEEYNKVFGFTFRIFIASIVAFFFAQMHDVWAFNFWKRLTGGKHLWFRNNASTMVSQFIDTTLFIFIAFYAATPLHDVFYMFALIIPYWLIKVLFAFFDTPFCYAGVRWLKKK